MKNNYFAEYLPLIPGDRNNGLSVMIAPSGGSCLSTFFFLQSGRAQKILGIQAGSTLFFSLLSMR